MEGSRLVLMKLKKALRWECRPCLVCCFPFSVILFRKETTIGCDAGKLPVFAEMIAKLCQSGTIRLNRIFPRIDLVVFSIDLNCLLQSHGGLLSWLEPGGRGPKVSTKGRERILTIIPGQLEACAQTTCLPPSGPPVIKPIGNWD